MKILLIAFFIFLTFAKPVQAVCPICTVAVGSALGISRILGIDDLISSLWIGAFILSSSFWLSDFLEKKGVSKKYSSVILISSIFYLLVLLPLYLTGVIGVKLNTFLGIDKILLGTAIGSLIFLFSIYLDKKVREKYGKQLFLYQKVILPVGLLLIMSLLLNYFI